MCDPDRDPYEGLDLDSSSEEEDKMADINSINDEEVLHKMMNQTDNFEERKKIRARLRDIRENEAAKFQASKQPRESGVEFRQRQAAAEKERKMKEFEEKGREGRQESNVMEQELRRKHAEAAKTKQEELEKMKEMGKVMSAAHHSGAEILSKADEKGRAVIIEGKN